MPTSNALSGNLSKKTAKTEAVRHRCRHGDDAAVFLRECRQLFAEGTGILRPAARTDTVRFGGSTFRKRMAVPLARVDVEEHAPLFKRMLCTLQRGKQLSYIVPVDDAHVGEPEMLEKPHVVFGDSNLAPLPPRGVHAPLDDIGIFGAFPHLFEDRRHASDRLGNGHPVIIQDDEDVCIQNFKAVERLVDEPVVEGTVADERNDSPLLPFEIARLGKAERRRDSGARMPVP